MDKIRQCTENLKRAVQECEAYKGFQKARKELEAYPGTPRKGYGLPETEL